MRKIAIANRKGGVGKTTTAVNLAHGLAMTGKKVLLIDTDAQGHCARLLGVEPEHGLAELYEGTITPSEAIVEARQGLHLLPGGMRLVRVNQAISQRMSRIEHALEETLSPYEGQFDFAIVDTAPGFNHINVNVLFYADQVLIPVSMEILSVEGFVSFQKEIDEMLKGRANVQIVPTFVDARVRKTKQILDALVNRYGDLLLFPIRYSTRLSESPATGSTIYEYAGKEAVAKDYMRLSEVLA